MSWVGNGAVAVAVVSALSLIFPAIGQTEGLPALLAVSCVWLVTWINIRGVREAGYEIGARAVQSDFVPPNINSSADLDRLTGL